MGGGGCGQGRGPDFGVKISKPPRAALPSPLCTSGLWSQSHKFSSDTFSLFGLFLPLREICAFGEEEVLQPGLLVEGAFPLQQPDVVLDGFSAAQVPNVRDPPQILHPAHREQLSHRVLCQAQQSWPFPGVPDLAKPLRGCARSQLSSGWAGVSPRPAAKLTQILVGFCTQAYTQLRWDSEQRDSSMGQLTSSKETSATGGIKHPGGTSLPTLTLGTQIQMRAVNPLPKTSVSLSTLILITGMTHQPRVLPRGLTRPPYHCS